jgi:Ca2+-binding EF-hand superfamily protein
MKKIIFPLLVAVMTAAVIVSAPSLAQGQQQGMGKNMPAFSEFDLNGDEAISSDEFYKARADRITKHAQEGREMKNLANAPSFEDIDTDGDEAISSEEFAAHQAGHRMDGE